MRSIFLGLLITQFIGSAYASPECEETFRNPIRQLREAAANKKSSFFKVPDVDVTLMSGKDLESYRLDDTLVSDLMTADQNIFLFRTITAPKYIKNFRPPQSWEDNKVGISYSLHPAMPLAWSFQPYMPNAGTKSVDEKRDLILVAFQSLTRDGLTFPAQPRAGKSGAEAFYSNPLKETTRLDEIDFYDEVKVPRTKENVIGVLRKPEFRQLFGSSLKDEYSLLDVLTAVANHAACTAP